MSPGIFLRLGVFLWVVSIGKLLRQLRLERTEVQEGGQEIQVPEEQQGDQEDDSDDVEIGHLRPLALARGQGKNRQKSEGR